MTGERDLGTLLATIGPELVPGLLVVTRVAGPAVPAGLHTFATVQEAEGLTLVLPREEADAAGLGHGLLLARITLRVHSDLAAVGLTAAVSAQLAAAGVSCNVIAGYAHDHLLVPHDRAEEALDLLQQLAAQSAAARPPRGVAPPR